MQNLLILIFVVTISYLLIRYLDATFYTITRDKTIKYINKNFEGYEILKMKEILNINETPFNKNELTPNFTGNSNIFNYRFYFKIELKNGNKKLLKWINTE